MTRQPESFLGKGWSFPPAFDKSTRKNAMLADEADIRSSLEILLNTTLGERVMRADYGSSLQAQLFEPMDESLRSYVQALIKDAIYLHEPRILPEEISVEEERDAGRLMITVIYSIPTTNSRANVVFPFYFLEGTNVKP